MKADRLYHVIIGCNLVNRYFYPYFDIYEYEFTFLSKPYDECKNKINFEMINQLKYYFVLKINTQIQLSNTNHGNKQRVRSFRSFLLMFVSLSDQGIP